MSEVKLKPCPFCGGKPTICKDNYSKILIMCKHCDMMFGIQLETGVELIDGWRAKLNTAEQAIKAWNTRYTENPSRTSENVPNSSENNLGE